MTQLAIKTCPTCGSRQIRSVKRDIESTRHGETFLARNIEIEECPQCGERLFSPDALDQIAAQRPHGTKHLRQRKTA